MQNTEKVKEDEVVKPPLGLMPRYIWHEHNRYPKPQKLSERIADIVQAISRYRGADVEIPAEWKAELADLNDALKNNF